MDGHYSAMRSAATLLMFVVVSLVPSLPARADDSITLTQGQDNYPLGPHLEILEDPGATLTIRDVTSPQFAGRFMRSHRAEPAFGFTRSAYWVRFRVRNASETITTWLLQSDYPLTDLIELYLPRGDGNYEVKRRGRSLPSTQEFPRRDHLFRLMIKAGEEKTYYLHLKSESLIKMQFVIWRQDAFGARDQAEYLLLGLYYGVILVMVVYNLFLYASLRDHAYLYYTLYVACQGITLLIVDGLALQYLWPAAPRWNRTAEQGLSFFFVFWAIAFARSFLHTRDHSPRFDRFLRLVQWSNGLLVPLSCFLSYLVSVQILCLQGTLMTVSLIMGAVISLHAGFRPARYFLIAWSWSLGGILTLVLNDIFFHHGNNFDFNVSKICFAIELVLLSLALADRINLMQEEKRRISVENERLYEHNVQQFQEKIRLEQNYSREKEYMIKDLHDSIGGMTSNIRLVAEMAQETDDVEAARKSLGTISVLSQDSIAEIRNFMQSLDRCELNWEGLTAEMTSHGYSVTEPHGLAFSFPAPTVPANVSQPCSVLYLNLLRIYKEALTNIVKHAGASVVTVDLRITDSSVHLSVHDNGVGVPAGMHRGRGLGHMRSRSEELGGRCEIVVDGGTCVRVDIPIPVKYRSEAI